MKFFVTGFVEQELLEEKMSIDGSRQSKTFPCLQPTATCQVSEGAGHFMNKPWF